MFKLKTVIILFLFIGISYTIKSQNNVNDFESLDSYFEKSISDWTVPGLAIGIVRNDSLIYAKGFGVKNINKKAIIDSKTVFPIASNTKAFTAAAIAILVDEGKLSWDTKVNTILPYFHLYDPYVTQHFTIADLLSHRSGLKTFSGDLLWYGTDYTREAVIKKLPLLKQHYEFRTKFGYSNIMYITAGEIIAKVSGMSYEDFIKKNILEPLNMNNTYTSINDLKELDNVCKAHNKVDGKVFPIEFLNWDNIGGAGILNSNVEDMGQWLKLQLNNGIWNGDTIFSPRQANEMRTPHTNFSVSSGYQRIWPSTHFKAYALGWSVNDYHGMKVVSHSGGYDGVITYSCFVPEANLGFVILTNSNSSLYNALSYKILDYFLSNDTTDWSGFFLPYQQRSEKREIIVAKEDAKEPSLSLKKYEGLYKSDLYGNALVKVKGKKMTVQLLHTKVWEGSISKYSADTFIVEFKKIHSLPQGFISFIVNNGEVESFIIDVPNPDFDFTEFNFKKLTWIEIPQNDVLENKE